MTQTHSVTQGEVFCPLRHKAVDVVSCYSCERVLTIDPDSRHPRVTCDVPAREETPV